MLLALIACIDPTTSPTGPRAEGPAEAPADPVIEDAGGRDLFDTTRIRTFDLTMEPADFQALSMQSAADTEWVEATVRMTSEDEDATLTGVGLQVKGSGTFLQWPDKASLKVKFDAFAEGQELYGVEKVAWHNMSWDASFLREHLAWWVFRNLGVPGARSTHVFLLDDGVAHWAPNNLYLQVEAYNKDFLERWFEDPTGPMWEGPGDFHELDELECERGDCEDTTVLAAMADAIENASDEEFMDATGEYLDWPAFFRFWAAEAMTQQGDGYTCARRNFHLYQDPTDGKLHFLPWSVDITFLQEDFLAFNDAGWNPLVDRCLAIAECRDALHDELLTMADDFEALDVVGELERTKALLDANGVSTPQADYELLHDIVADTPGVTRAWVAAHSESLR